MGYGTDAAAVKVAMASARPVLSRRRMLGTLAGTVCVAAGLAAGPGPALAQSTDIWTASDAQSAMERGEMVLIDLRSRAEWEATGLAEGAWPVSLHEARFEARLRKALDLAGDRTVGLICAAGGRSGRVQRILRNAGIARTIDVAEGMMGSSHGPGWIRSGLPVVPLSTGLDALPADISGL